MKQTKLTRVVVLMSKDDSREMRSKLMVEGQSLSGWVREQVKKYLNKK